MRKKIFNIFKSFGETLFQLMKHQPFVIVATITCFFLFSFFGEVVDDVLEGDSHAIDEKILLMLRDPENVQSPLGPGWLEEMMRDFTALGGIGLLTLVTIASFIYLLTTRRTRHAFYLLSVVATGTILSNLMKIGFDRPRPDLVPHDSITYMAGFPSGHSFMATVVYLTLGTILAEAEPRKPLKIYLISIAVFIALIVGVSRVYLGVHWPSDVLAGWLIGAGWALAFWILTTYLELRHILRKDKN